MPAKNTIKSYIKNGYYHLYNRGVEKRKIFLDEQDYSVFLLYLSQYLLPKDEENLHQKLADPTISSREKDKIIKLLRLNNFADKLYLLAYCLMPNHFHFFVSQKEATTIDAFMQSLLTRYSMYFNRKYKRVGSLFQAVYKAVLITTEEQFLYLSVYIHRQAIGLQNLQGETLRGNNHQPSSYLEYIGKRNSDWVKPYEVLKYFSPKFPTLTYETFTSQGEESPVNHTFNIEES